MILIILVISLIILFFSFIFKPRHGAWLGLSGAMLVVAVVCLVGIVGNIQRHWGMSEVATTQTTIIRNPTDKLTYVALGKTNQELVYVYNTDQKKQLQTDPEHDQVQVEHLATKTAKLTTVCHEYAYTNSGSFWFGLTGKNHQLISRDRTFTLPKGYQVVQTGRKVF